MIKLLVSLFVAVIVVASCTNASEETDDWGAKLEAQNQPKLASDAESSSGQITQPEYFGRYSRMNRQQREERIAVLREEKRAQEAAAKEAAAREKAEAEEERARKWAEVQERKAAGRAARLAYDKLEAERTSPWMWGTDKIDDDKPNQRSKRAIDEETLSQRKTIKVARGDDNRAVLPRRQGTKEKKDNHNDSSPKLPAALEVGGERPAQKERKIKRAKMVNSESELETESPQSDDEEEIEKADAIFPSLPKLNLEMSRKALDDQWSKYHALINEAAERSSEIRKNNNANSNENSFEDDKSNELPPFRELYSQFAGQKEPTPEDPFDGHGEEFKKVKSPPRNFQFGSKPLEEVKPIAVSA